MVKRADLEKARRKGRVELRKEEITYERVREEVGSISRGTVLLPGGRAVCGYPHIKRVFALEKGVARNISSTEIWAEEKIDGFNLRVALIRGNVYAFSRGGMLDHFATEKVRGLPGIAKFFSKHGAHVLCGEMIGNTPYTSPTNDYDVKFLVFDIDAGENEYAPQEEKYALLRRFGIEGVPVFGKFRTADARKLKSLAVKINQARKEGMVMKSPDRREVVKFVTANSDIQDIAETFYRMHDMPIGFYYQRLIRSGMFVKEMELSHREYGDKLGKAVYEGYIRWLRRVEKGEPVSEHFEIIVRDPASFEWIRKNTGKEVKIEKEFEREEPDGRTRIGFRKVYRKSDKALREMLGGKAQTD
ncbi:MAG: RNA ligase [Candidatus Bilamarchaeaceae archaeon]